MTKVIQVTVTQNEQVIVTDQDMHALAAIDVADIEHFHSSPKHIILHSNGHTYLVALSVTRRPEHLAHI